jgi:hypothetical protein
VSRTRDRSAARSHPGHRLEVTEICRCHALYGSQDSCPSPFIPTRQNLVSKTIGRAPSRRRFAFHRAKATVVVNSLAWALFVADVGIGYRVAKPASVVSPKTDWRGLGCCPAKGRGRNLDTTKVLSGSAGWSPRVIPPGLLRTLPRARLRTSGQTGSDPGAAVARSNRAVVGLGCGRIKGAR